MTGILLTNENFKKFSKNLNKIKPEITLSQAQEELSNIFGFKNLFQAKKEIENRPFYINNDNFDYFSSRLKLNIESSKIKDSFAFILGYVDYEIFSLHLWTDSFISSLSESFKKVENLDKCFFGITNKDLIFVARYLPSHNKTINTSILINMSPEKINITIDQVINRKDLDSFSKKAIEDNFSLFCHDQNFIYKVKDILKKKLLINSDNVEGKFSAKLIHFNHEARIKTVVKEPCGYEYQINEYLYKKRFHIIPSNIFEKYIINSKTLNKNYTSINGFSAYNEDFIFNTLEEAKDKAPFSMNKFKVKSVYIVEVFHPLFYNGFHEKTDVLCEKYFEFKKEFSITGYSLIEKTIKSLTEK